MPTIAVSDLKFYKPGTVSDGGANGGRMSANQITSGAAQNVFPTVGESERTVGSLKYRKVFCKVANDDDLALAEPKVFLDKYTPGDDRVTFFEASQTDTQAAITGSEKEYGAGKLDSNVVATATTLDILVEDGADHPFEDGDLIRVSDRPSVSEAGNAEFVTIDGTPSVAGDVVSIVFTPALANNYAASDTRIANVYVPNANADVEASFENVDLTSAAGTFDEDFLLGDAIGAIEQQITFTWTSATAFSITSDVLGALGAGSVGAGASPVNGSFGKPYFVAQAAAFGGTFAPGDTLVFDAHPASVPVWMKRVVPAGTAALTVNGATLVMRGETTP